MILGLAAGGLWPADTALAAPSALGDFNGDGRADLAVAVPQEDIGTVAEVGAANVLYGGASGLSTAGNQFWQQNSPGILETVEPGDLFSRVAAGDFDGDGFADLAVGAVGENIGSTIDAGVVHVLYGGAAGLSATGNQLWHQNRPGVLDGAEPGDRFGDALAAGDFNDDGRADLAVGVPREDVGTLADAGAVNVLYGGAAGLSATGNQIWNQNSAAVEEDAEEPDLFGFAVAAGDFNGNRGHRPCRGRAGGGPRNRGWSRGGEHFPRQQPLRPDGDRQPVLAPERARCPGCRRPGRFLWRFPGLGRQGADALT